MHNNLCCDIQRGLFFMKIEQAIKEFLIEIEIRQFTPRTGPVQIYAQNCLQAPAE